jgi:ABC-type Zn uptake system ZnuABC Zn-binding protein ZnuA
VIAALVCVAATACGTTKLAATDPGKPTVVATTTQMQDLVKNVGGDQVNTIGILKPNVDPHEFEPSPSDAIGIAGAKLAVTSGVGIDTWAAQLIADSGSGAKVFDASAGLPIRTGDSEEPDGDPHWWHDPTLYERAAHSLGAELGRIDPAHRAQYAANARRYVARLTAMDSLNKRVMACLPADNRKLVTNHDAFAYFAAHYGLTVVGSVIPSVSTAAEPSAHNVADLIQKIKAEHVRAIFTESSLNPSLEDQIAHEAGVRTYATLYGDTLGPPGSPGATYIGMERWNVRSIVAGLLGHEPPAGGCVS